MKKKQNVSSTSSLMNNNSIDNTSPQHKRKLSKALTPSFNATSPKSEDNDFSEQTEQFEDMAKLASSIIEGVQNELNVIDCKKCLEEYTELLKEFQKDIISQIDETQFKDSELEHLIDSNLETIMQFFIELLQNIDLIKTNSVDTLHSCLSQLIQLLSIEFNKRENQMNSNCIMNGENNNNGGINVQFSSNGDGNNNNTINTINMFNMNIQPFLAKQENFVFLINSLSSSIKRFIKESKQVVNNFNSLSSNVVTLLTNCNNNIKDVNMFISNNNSNININKSNTKQLKDKTNITLKLIDEVSSIINELRNQIDVIDNNHMSFYGTAKEIFKNLKVIYNEKMSMLKQIIDEINNTSTTNIQLNMNNTTSIEHKKRQQTPSPHKKQKHKQQQQHKMSKSTEHFNKIANYQSYTNNTNNNVNIKVPKHPTQKTMIISHNDINFNSLNNTKHNISQQMELSNVNELTEKNKELKNEITKMSKENAQLKHNLNSLQQSYEQLSNFNNSVPNLNNPFNNVSKNTDTVKYQQHTTHKCGRCNMLSEKILEFLKAMKDLQSNIVKKAYNINELKKDFERKKLALNNLALINDDTNNHNNHNNGSSNNNKEKYEKEISSLTEINEQLKQQINELNNELNIVNKELIVQREKDENVKQEFTDKIKEKEQTIKDIENKLQKAQDTINTMNNNIINNNNNNNNANYNEINELSSYIRSIYELLSQKQNEIRANQMKNKDQQRLLLKDKDTTTNNVGNSIELYNINSNSLEQLMQSNKHIFNESKQIINVLSNLIITNTQNTTNLNSNYTQHQILNQLQTQNKQLITENNFLKNYFNECTNIIFDSIKQSTPFINEDESELSFNLVSGPGANITTSSKRIIDSNNNNNNITNENNPSIEAAIDFEMITNAINKFKLFNQEISEQMKKCYDEKEKNEKQINELRLQLNKVQNDNNNNNIHHHNDNELNQNLLNKITEQSNEIDSLKQSITKLLNIDNDTHINNDNDSELSSSSNPQIKSSKYKQLLQLYTDEQDKNKELRTAYCSLVNDKCINENIIKDNNTSDNMLNKVSTINEMQILELENEKKSLEEQLELALTQLTALKTELKANRDKTKELLNENDNLKQGNNSMLPQDDIMGTLRNGLEKLINEIQLTSKVKELLTVILRVVGYDDKDIYNLYNVKEKKKGFLNMFK